MVLSGIVTPVCLSHDHKLLAEFARILKPSGLLVIREPIVEQGMLTYQPEEGNHRGNALSDIPFDPYAMDKS